MNNIKEHDILICTNEKDSHFLKLGKVENIEYDEYYPIIKNINIKYDNDLVTYKALDMEYEFMIVNGTILSFD